MITNSRPLCIIKKKFQKTLIKTQFPKLEINFHIFQIMEEKKINENTTH